MNKQLKIFENGSTWLRADFHLHTRADTEFDKTEFEENDFCRLYVEKLVEQKIGVGIITNHNKFRKEEYKAIAKKARKQEIYILPGVELSVNDGANGIHCLVIFDPTKWLENDNDFINQFLTQTFAGKANYENENGRSNDSLIESIKKLDAFKKDYFMIMAHIEQKSGFYNELDGGRITELGNIPIFRKAVLGFQKVRTGDYINNLNLWLQNDLPTFVEGSDPKKIAEIGKGEKTYLKLGAYNFEAIKYALLDNKFRVSKSPTNSTNGYIKSISINGKKFKGNIHFNHAMNNLIGIRGSGKSSILEVIRYALDIELNEKENADYDYKRKLLNALLGSGGTIRCELIDNQGNTFYSEKTLGDTQSNVFNAENELQVGLKPNAIVQKPIYFGQKDLSNIGDDLSTENLIGKLVGNRLLGKKEEIEEKKQQVLSYLNDIKKTNAKLARKPDYEAKLADLKHKIQIFKYNEIDQKLDKQIRFNKDLNFVARVAKFEDEMISALDEYSQEYEDGFATFQKYKAEETSNVADIKAAIKSLLEFETIFKTLSKTKTELAQKNMELKKIGKRFKEKFKALKTEFDEIKRQIKLPNIQADDYVKFTKDLDITKVQLSELDKLSKKKKELELKLNESLETLQKLWHNEFTITQKEIEKVNNEQPAIDLDDKEVKTLEIQIGFRENKTAFKSYLNRNFTGTGIRDMAYNAIVNYYPDLISIYHDLDKKESELKNILTDTQLLSFRKYFKVNLSAYLTYRTPDKFDILYKGRPINEHSLGQRASALIIFLLTLKDSDLIIIDQPEDDLDNQTIYNDVIKVLKDLKNDSQFIFATHNPNIPVLGDCEQIITCKYHNEKIEIEQGSIDSEQSRIDIVNIMEGGKEAFNNRKMIYELWTQ